MSQINVDIVAPQSGTSVEVSGIEITSPTSTPIGVYGQNIAIGSDALSSTTVGGGLLAIGENALKNCVPATEFAGNNIALGNESLINNTLGAFNIAIGYESMKTNIGGDSNISIGHQALGGLSSSTVAFGNDGNIAIGQQSLNQIVGASGNVSVGVNSGAQMTNGIFNTFIGNAAGVPTTTGNNNVCIGYDSKAATATTSNSVTLGNNSISVIRAAVTTITSLSDARDKKDVKELEAGLDFVKGLKPVEFVWDDRDESGKHDVKDFGFIAQDLKKSQEDAGLAETLKLVYEENPEKLEASYGKLVPILVKAIQDLAKEVEILKSK